ncbi:Rv0361 family membrane protein [Rhodococcus spongiicola]|uniref:Lumazine-binding protein n=1 Tax=Rhodococcus spongiicola TaxID=2487352 RepID=A0A3S3B2M4_9NOCA|nr:hypothetical protein [Rhodococcus spongiicola]RVW01695.1 hypothetical protein EF834_14950 [Rhodococcus spongiicola]
MSPTDDFQAPTPPAGTGPQRIAPATPSAKPTEAPGGWRGRLTASNVAFAGVLVTIGVISFLIVRIAQSGPESEVRDAVKTFVAALESGDLSALQASTCGTLADFYQDIPPAEFADVHADAVTDGGIPVITSIDSVQITDDSAIAQVTAHTQGNPSDESPRTFDLERIDGAWRVCAPE